LRRYNMKYRIVGGFSFYERAEIKDMVSYLTVALNPHDSVNLMRIVNSPPRGIGKDHDRCTRGTCGRARNLSLGRY
jgi:DNA helicase-2/ATP-dependent DNA helicase PcrA